METSANYVEHFISFEMGAGQSFIATSDRKYLGPSLINLLFQNGKSGIFLNFRGLFPMYVIIRYAPKFCMHKEKLVIVNFQAILRKSNLFVESQNAH